jgi:hypothetical protein
MSEQREDISGGGRRGTPPTRLATLADLPTRGRYYIAVKVSAPAEASDSESFTSPS